MIAAFKRPSVSFLLYQVRDMLMFHRFVLSLPLALLFSVLVGCGGDGGGPAVMQEQSAYTEADEKAAEDYEKTQMDNAEKMKSYGK